MGIGYQQEDFIDIYNITTKKNKSTICFLYVRYNQTLFSNVINVKMMHLLTEILFNENLTFEFGQPGTILLYIYLRNKVHIKIKMIVNYFSSMPYAMLFK